MMRDDDGRKPERPTSALTRMKAEALHDAWETLLADVAGAAFEAGRRQSWDAARTYYDEQLARAVEDDEELTGALLDATSADAEGDLDGFAEAWAKVARAVGALYPPMASGAPTNP